MGVQKRSKELKHTKEKQKVAVKVDYLYMYSAETN